MNADLRNLIALQDIDQKILRIQKEIADIPGKLQSSREELQRLNDDHQNKVTRHQELGKQRRTREGEVDLMRTKLSRLKDQLMTVKTNKEYTAMLHEIQMAEEQIRKAEDEILDAMEEMEGTEKELKAAETDLKRRLDEIQELIRKDEASVPQLEAEVGDLLVRKSDVEKLIPGELLDRYRRIADKRKGVALAEAKDELCTLCHVRIRPQVYADLRQGEVINACDSCSRILFVREAV